MEFLALNLTWWSAIVPNVRAVKTSLMLSAGEPLLGIVSGQEERNKVSRISSSLQLRKGLKSLLSEYVFRTVFLLRDYSVG